MSTKFLLIDCIWNCIVWHQYKYTVLAAAQMIERNFSYFMKHNNVTEILNTTCKLPSCTNYAIQSIALCQLKTTYTTSPFLQTQLLIIKFINIHMDNDEMTRYARMRSLWNCEKVVKTHPFMCQPEIYLCMHLICSRKNMLKF